MSNLPAMVEQFSHEIANPSQAAMLKQVLPQHLPVEKFIRAATIAVTNTPSLLDADRRSLFTSLQRCATDGLVPDGREAALIEFNTKSGNDWIKKVQYMPMVDGVLKRARQTGEIASITARAVYQNDEFDYFVDENGEHLKHRPNFRSDRGEMILVYAIAKMKDGLVIVEPMTMADVNRVRLASKNPDRGPWKDWFDRMALKSALHRLARRLPNSSEIMEMLDQGNVLYDCHDKEEKDISPARPQRETYSDESFKANFPTWEAAVHAGKVTPQQIIDKVGSLADLSQEQIDKIKGIQAKEEQAA